MESINEITIFPRTRKEIEKRLLELLERLELNTTELQFIGADQDGDVMDDTNFRNLRAQRELMQSEQVYLNWLVGSAIYNKSDLNRPTNVLIGSKVKLQVVYPDGEKEEISITIVGPKEAKYLPQYIRGDEKDLIMSAESPIAKAALGGKIDQQFEFNAPGGKGTIQIKDIQVSDYLNSES